MKPLQSENHHQFLSTHFLDQNPLGFAYFSGNELLLSYANSNFYKF